MHRIPHNVERSKFRRGEYVGYGDGVWRIQRSVSGRAWIATHPRHLAIYAFTLLDIGNKIADTVGVAPVGVAP